MNSNNAVFEFVSYTISENKQQIEFKYAITEKAQIEFTEVLQLPSVISPDIPDKILQHLLHSVHLMLGISYWKLYCPKKIKISTKHLSKEQAQFWNIVYTKGLGEFFYKNNIDFHNLVQFPFDEIAATSPVVFPRSNKSLVGIGGGKDSIVTAELLAKAQKDFMPIIIETQKEHSISHEIVKLLDKKPLLIKRFVDAKLFDLNKNPSTYNGHIPISAVFAFIGVLSAVLYDFSFLIVSNEQSANYGNVEYLGETINHQWSKTKEFEELFQKYVRTFITPDITYFSLLRSLSEYSITQLFSEMTKYHTVFSSCNRNYAINKDLPQTHWCGECPKCAFTFIMLAVFLPKDQVTAIFGQDLLTKNSLEKVYKELLGVEGVKPFECVGTPEEVKLAFYKVHEKGEFIDESIMTMFEKEVLPSMKNVEELEKRVISQGEDLIPEEFKEVIKLSI
jgi:7-cyano-7-deazaguanine synthase in queuosine biosynthesis